MSVDSLRQPRLQAPLAELVGTAGLLAVVIGSGIMAERLSGGNMAVALLGNTLATVCGLWVLIGLFGSISGAHFNPLVSLYAAWRGELPARALPGYVLAQCLGAVAGAMLANLMFDGAALQVATKLRASPGLWLGEVVATAGLLLTIWKLQPRSAVPAGVAAYIGAAYWFTSSTSFANPVAVLGRMFSDSFAGIAPASAAYFVAAQVAGLITAAFLIWLFTAPTMEKT
jgi:glycerol uptake facilitator-like aquaporin